MYVHCYVHGQPFPKSACHLHHEAPQAAGGSDDQSNLIWLCATCHSSSHRVAQYFQHGQPGMAEDTCMSLYPLPAQRARFKQVVKEILQAEEQAKRTGKKRAKARVELDLPHETYNKLKTVAADARAGGKKLAVTKLIEGIINQYLRTKGL